MYMQSAHAAAAQSLEELRQTAAALQQRLDTEQQQRKVTADELTSQLQVLYPLLSLALSPDTVPCMPSTECHTWSHNRSLVTGHTCRAT